MSEENNGNGLEKKRFQVKSGLAVSSFIAMIVLTLLLWFVVPESRLKIISEASTWMYFACTSITGAAVGFQTWSQKTK